MDLYGDICCILQGHLMACITQSCDLIPTAITSARTLAAHSLVPHRLCKYKKYQLGGGNIGYIKGDGGRVPVSFIRWSF